MGLFKKVQVTVDNESGFTLVEVMIAGAILSVLVLGMSSFIVQQARQNQQVEAKREYGELKEGVVQSSSSVESLTRSEEVSFDQIKATAVAGTPQGQRTSGGVLSDSGGNETDGPKGDVAVAE